ncbi:MAG: chemotaxis protein CheD [Christensenellaceae bacterium]|jgi:chemotaxis protein CheD
MKNVIIGMAELGVVKQPETIVTLGLGSCVGIVLYDKVNKIGGMVHVVLPDSTKATEVNRAKFADTGPEELLNKMIAQGASRPHIVAKLAGGAHMFGNINTTNDTLKVGQRNAFVSKMAVLKLRIPIIAEDLGGTYGRTITLRTEDGSLEIKTVGKGVKVI